MISEVERNDFGLKFDLRTLKLLSYYELDYTEQVYSLIDSYKHYIKNSKEANNAGRKSKKLLLNALLILMKIKTGNDLNRITQLNTEVKKLNVWLQKWFNDKINGLIKINK